jgi:hypothetical protein
MGFFNLIFDHFWEVVIFLILFGGSIGAALRWIIRQSFEHHERMQEKRNEQLRLQIQLEQARNERISTQRPPVASDPLPKDASWDDEIQTTYEMGYQHIHQQ